MARRKPELTLIACPEEADWGTADPPAETPAHDLVQSLRIAAGEALSRVERIAECHSYSFRQALRDLKSRQRRLRFARRRMTG